MKSLQKEKKNRIYHGGRKTKLYQIWCGMKQRCFSKSDKSYGLYGGRGITVCDEWKNNFVLFRNWSMKNGYKEGLSIDRIDNNGNYCPENCRWVTSKEQNNNKRNTIRIEYNGETKTLQEWADYLEIHPDTLYSRIFRSKLTIERAFEKPIRNEDFSEPNENCVMEILTEVSPNKSLFTNTLSKETKEEISRAIEIMENRSEHDKTRLKYCKSKLRAIESRRKIDKLAEMEGKK